MIRSCSCLLFASAFGSQAVCGAVCEPKDFRGAYGFSLTGTTTIGGATRPVAVVARLVLDGSGTVSGVSSAAFTGLVLGNPVTGIYAAQTDCSVTWSLQDDSGNFQHFQGTMTAGGQRVTFRQTDPGAARNGVLLRAPERCSESSLAGEFDLTVSGSTVNVDTGLGSGSVSISGVVRADGAGGLSYAPAPAAPSRSAGTYEFHDDCFVDLTMTLPSGRNESAELKFRAILVEEGRTVLGIQTDPGAVVTLRLVSR